jgi:1-aminocyclopropane-1-carboxylate deaminase
MDCNFPIPEITRINLPNSQPYHLDMLRLDLIHPTISGNKWYKLLPQFNNSSEIKKVVTMGGAFSNHLHATAFYCNRLQLESVAYVRGDEVTNDTLNDCKNWGMSLKFLPRSIFDAFVNDSSLLVAELEADSLFIPMGGFNKEGMHGTEMILNAVQSANYDYIVTPVGTGTTYIGLLNTSTKHQHVIGIASVKDKKLVDNIQSHTSKKVQINFDYTFGGFAKVNTHLIDFITSFKADNNIWLDVVYTGKMMFAINDWIDKRIFPNDVKILCLHTGGLQGNRSYAAELGL